MIMKGLAALFGGSGMLSTPVLVVGLVIAAWGWHQARDVRLKSEGRTSCQQSWMVAFAKQKERNARKEARLAQDILDGERTINTELKDELERARQEASDLRIAADKPDPNCLSSGVLDALRKRTGLE